MTRVVIIGAGGHATVVADILLRAMERGSGQRPVAAVDDNPALEGTALLGLPVVGPVASLGNIPHDAVIVAVGDNAARAALFRRLRASGAAIVSAVHPAAVLAPDVSLGDGVMICAGVVVNAASAIADNVILNTGSTVDHHNEIGAHAHIAPGVHLGGTVRVGEGALVGIGAAVLPGRRIGTWATIGAGAVVVQDIPDGAVAAGVPARIIKRTAPGMTR